jgi:predicted alpha/beta superfamily hydrolase
MKQIIRITLLLLLVSTGRIQLSAQSPAEVVIGRIDNLRSGILQEQRTFWVHLPPGAQGGQHTNKKYPVVYVLDGDKNFTSVVGMIDLLSSVNGNNVVPEMIVIGILNTNRVRDLTPTHVDSGLWINDDMAKWSGGGEKFTAFLEHELIPYIDSSYPASPYRMLIGHSLGGLVAVSTLLLHPHLFRSYVVIEPSMWWDSQKLLHATTAALAHGSGPLKGTNIFLGMAHTQVPGMDTSRLQKDTTSGTLHPRSILELAHALTSATAGDQQVAFKYYDAESHASVPVIATYDALHVVFADYPLQFQDNYFSDSTFLLAAFIAGHYQKIAGEYAMTSEDGRSVPPIDLINNLGFFVLGKKQYAKAEAMFRMNIQNYPADPVAYNYLGDLYAAKGDKGPSVASYKKALSFGEDAAIRKKLAALQ